MQEPNNHALPPGYRLMQYQIDKVLSSGGFSYVYLAHDDTGERVAIKEYLPVSLALRTGGDKVEANSEDMLACFRHGMKSFFEEGRALAKINHNNIVRVLNFFRANDTVYMVMQYEHGKSLQEYILSHQGPVKETLVRGIFSQLLNGLREVHTRKLLHLDIKPANIYLRRDGSPVLLDFGSARQTLTDAEHRIPPSYTPGYAAPEQYFDRRQLGPWSDIYSVGASMYSCLMRAAPPAADLRIKQDTLVPAGTGGKGIYSDRLLEIIDWCLQLDHLKRPQSVFSLQKSLLEKIPPSASRNSLLATLLKRFSNKR